MPICTIAGIDAQYYLILFDKNGDERPEPDGSMLSEDVRTLIADTSVGITDVIFASHGWKGDIPAAIEQYDCWVGEMVRSPDHVAAKIAYPKFKAIVIGLHWPSLPFGDERIPAKSGLLSANVDDGIEEEIEQYAASVADSAAAKKAIRTIVTAARRDTGTNRELSAEVRKAYRKLYAEAHLDGAVGDVAAPPGIDHAAWNPDAIYRTARRAVLEADPAIKSKLLGGRVSRKIKGLILAPLQQLSFWKMKDRARHIGETGGHELLQKLQCAGKSETRFHLMGHSFGCIVVSAAIAGPPSSRASPRPIDSLSLIQGALSLWSFSSMIPFATGKVGYFNHALTKELVRGPIVTTRSSYDKAVRKLYPFAVRLARQYLLGKDLPKYGGIGTFGAQGLGDMVEDLEMHSATQDYKFMPKRVYNLEASNTIKNGAGFSGAHSDIAHPEVAHAIWSAILASK